MSTTRATWPIAAAMYGAVLPLSFIAGIDGYLKYATTIEIVRLYGDICLLHAPLVLLAMLLSALAAASLARLRSQPSEVVAHSISSWLGRLLVAIAFYVAARAWLVSVGVTLDPSGVRRVVIAATLLGSTLWFSFSQPGASRFLKMLAQVSWFTVLPAMGVALLARMPETIAKTAPQTTTVATERMADRPRDVVLITVDTLSAQHMSLYGYPRTTTPKLDQFARHAVVFDRCYANGNWTSPGIASLLSGRRPWSTRADSARTGPLTPEMSDNVLALARNAGYSTLVVTTNLNADPRRQKVDRWVDEHRYALFSDRGLAAVYLGVTRLGFLEESFAQGYLPFVLDRGLLQRWNSDPPNRHYDPDAAFAAARELWQAHAGRPRFLWVHIMPPHDPYAAPAPFLGTYAQGPRYDTYWTSSPPARAYAGTDKQAILDEMASRYDEAILYSDHHVGAFLDWLDQRRDLDQALVVVTADHGESFHHAYGGHEGIRLYDEIIHIPLIVRAPSAKPGRVSAIVEQVDLLPTLAGVLHVAQGEPEGKPLPLDARDITSAKQPTAWSMSLAQNSRFRELDTGAVALLAGPYKYVHYFGDVRHPGAQVVKDELHNVLDDPLETRDLSGQEPAVAASMKAAVESELARQNRMFHARHAGY